MSLLHRTIDDLLAYWVNYKQRRPPESENWAVNWGDLHVHTVSHIVETYENGTEYVYYNVLIDEACEENEKFHQAIKDAIKNIDFKDKVEIYTEW